LCPVLKGCIYMFDAIIASHLDALASMSQKYGCDPEYVLAGGGNTSYKSGVLLYVKGSGTSLATIKPEDFVVMRRDRLDEIWDKSYPEDDDAREAEVLADMMAARADGENRRPSVEALLHSLFPFPFVLHVHPALVNGMTCGADGEKICAELFPDSVWIPEVKPGYTLAALCRSVCAEYGRLHGGEFPRLMFLQNHGVFFAGVNPSDIDELVERVMGALRVRIDAEPDFTELRDETDGFWVSDATAIAVGLRYRYGLCVVFSRSRALLEYDPATKPLTPDHIVYTRAWPLVTAAESLAASYDSYVAEHGCTPRIVVVPGIGTFACGRSAKEADTALALWRDEVKATFYARSFGGVRSMSDEMIDFITRWEVESYRAKVAESSDTRKRFEGKIAVVTGGAQGFGRGIAEALAADGAYVAIADMNFEGAQNAAAEIGKTSPALAIRCDVTDERSVADMINSVVLRWGGVDVFINNAGIVRAGSLDEMTLDSFRLVTSVNYTAYFLCAKYASAVMKLAHSFDPGRFFDIIEINSKSGLSGSKKNFAYAGSKFGGIGLTQSFALELAPYNIKVNAVCPGNFLEGPLWTDPEKGLLVQYLRAGKVPGAKTTDDVRKFYESKVPLGRGCRIADVARAIAYIIEQEYETGQALPVTGGQEMLK
jgi:NAD(P)-dependent dehydrogenase (short-subunit alcohol dehydrogenase family)/rhamnose utilization protein RhaD (predicted bifunctional aldolase and dehydrogenase)